MSHKEMPVGQKETTFENLLKALPIIFLVSIVLAISLFFVSPFSKRKLFAVQGAVGTTQEALIEKSGIKPTDYISQVYLNLDSHEKAIVENEPWVKSAEFNYEFPNIFHLTVEEYNILAYYQVTEGWQPVLSSGEFLETIDQNELPSSFIAIDLKDKKEVSKLVTKLALVEEDVRRSISTISSADSTSTKDLLQLKTVEGHEIIVPLSDLDTKLPYYKTIRGKLSELRLIDMEVGIFTRALMPTVEQVQQPTEEQVINDVVETVEVVSENLVPDPVTPDAEQVIVNQEF